MPSLVPPVLLLVAGATLTTAQNVRLSGDMPRGPGGQVGALRVSADGLRALHVVEGPRGASLFAVATDGSLPAVELAQGLDRSDADFGPGHATCLFTTPEAGGQRALHRVPTDGGPGAVLAVEDIASFRPAAARVVFARRPIVGGALFSVLLDGSQAPVQLSPAGHIVQYASDFLCTPDGQRVVYSTRAGLYVVPADGSQAPTELRFSSTQVIEAIDLTPDGQRALFYQSSSSGVRGLYSVRLDGAQPAVKLNPPGLAGYEHAVTPDGARTLFLHTASGQRRLYGAPTDGSAPAVRLDSLPPSGGDVHSFRLDPLGLRAAYLANPDGTGVELFSVLAAGGQAPVKLNGAYVAGGGIDLNFGAFSLYAIAPDAARVVYVADQETNGTFELFAAPIDGSAPALKLSGPMVAGGGLLPAQSTFEPPFQISADGTRVAYVADQLQDGVYELFSAAIDGSAPAVRLSAPLPLGADVGIDLDLAAGGRLLFLGEQDANDERELFAVPFDASAPPQQLSAPFAPGAPVGDVIAYQLAPNERSVVYLADQEVNEGHDLFRAPVDGSSAPIRLNPPATDATPVIDFRITADGARVVYTRVASSGWGFELHSAPMDGSGIETRLDDASAPPDVLTFQLGGDRVAFGLGLLPRKLFGVPSDGSQPAQLLDLPTATSSIQQFAFSPDGTRVVFVADEDADERYELYSVPSDGGQPPTLLNPPLVAGGDVVAFQISPDSSRVVFQADLLADERFELFAVPLAGGAVVRLNRALVAGGDVSSFRIAADSLGVVYAADGDADEVRELYAVPFAAPLAYRLNDPLVLGGDVADFTLSADSQRVLFLADARVDQRPELFSVPIDRSLAPVSVSGALGAGGAVASGWDIDGASRFVVYRASTASGAPADLFRAPLDGHAPARRLTQLAAGTTVTEHRLAADGRWVVFRADARALGRFELFRVPSDGSEPPLALNPYPGARGDVATGSLALTRSGRALYLADQRQNEVVELFASELRAPAIPARR